MYVINWIKIYVLISIIWVLNSWLFRVLLLIGIVDVVFWLCMYFFKILNVWRKLNLLMDVLLVIVIKVEIFLFVDSGWG